MKILYLDLNPDIIEDYSTSLLGENPNKYGGGSAVARVCRANPEWDFWIAGNPKCFDNIKDKSKCICFPDEIREALRNGIPLENFLNLADFDILVHHFTQWHVQTKLPTAIWAVGRADYCHCLNKNILLFDKENQCPIINGPTDIHEFTLGIPIKPFREYQKEPFIFNCNRQTKLFQSAIVARICREYKIKLVTAGPIDSGYESEFLNYVDDGFVQYLGIIDQETKNYYNERASATVMLQTYPISVTLSSKEAATFGVPTLATNIGGWPAFLNGRNGFVCYDVRQLLESWEKCIDGTIKQKDCYDAVKEKYSSDKMLVDLNNIFKKVINESP